MPLHKRLGIISSTRASFFLYNTPEEVDTLGEGLVAVKQVFRRK
jgi:cysteine desulfurase/selenocysteine lyase